MQTFVADCLSREGYQPVLAYYLPYSIAPDLSVPVFRLLGRQAGKTFEMDETRYERHGIGAWLPELEFTHYWATDLWRTLASSCDFFVSVSGSALAATAFKQLRLPYMSWVASGWEADRCDRVRAFALPRKAIDRCLNAPVLRRMEKAILRTGTILALSQYTKRTLEDIAGPSAVDGIMPMPIATQTFAPAPEKVVAGRIGFVGRLSDPRKNIDLLIETLAILREQSGRDVTLTLIGGEAPPRLLRHIGRLGLETHVSLLPSLSKDELARTLQTLDVFVVPSRQEGLCIAALEAMACGCPIVSTRCGGPEEFVKDGVTGFLVDAEPLAMAAAIEKIVAHRALRARMSSEARRLVSASYSHKVAESIFWRHFAATFTTKRHSCHLS